MALMFFPRGGSAQVSRYMAAALPTAGWEVTLVSGSLGPPGADTNAETFFRGLDVRSVDYTEAREAEDPALTPIVITTVLHPPTTVDVSD